MRLYKNTRGQWFGTQADAKAGGADWKEINVPTDKPSLLQWLNMGAPFEHDLCDTPDTPVAAPVVHQSTLTKPHPWQTIKECAERAPLRDFPVAIAVYQNRIDELI